MLRGRLTKRLRTSSSLSSNGSADIFAVCCEIEAMLEQPSAAFESVLPAATGPVNIYLPMDYADAFTSARIQCCIFWFWEVLWMLSEKENYHRFPSDSRGGKNSGGREEMANVMHNSSSHPCHHPSSKWTRHQHHHRAIIPVLPLQNRHVNGLSHNLLCESKQMPVGCVVTFRN